MRGVSDFRSLGDRIEPGFYELHSRFRRVLNFSDGTRMVAAVTPEIGAGPINLELFGLEFGSLQNIRIDPEFLFLDSRPVRRRELPTYDSGLDLPRLSKTSLTPAGPVSRRLASWSCILAETAPVRSLVFLLDERRRADFRTDFERALVATVDRGAEDLRFWRPVPAARRLAGCGFGLTPSGDDFNAGLLIGLNALEATRGLELRRLKERVFATARRGSPLSDTQLRLAREGRVVPAVKSLLAALFGELAEAGFPGRQEALVESTRQLCRMGATSGADLATGLLMTLRAGLYRELHRPSQAEGAP